MEKEEDEVPTPEEKVEEKKEEDKVDTTKWGVGRMPTQFEPVIMRGEGEEAEVLDKLTALALILNKLDEIQEVGGFSKSK